MIDHYSKLGMPLEHMNLRALAETVKGPICDFGDGIDADNSHDYISGN
jgi:hypothetical protein